MAKGSAKTVEIAKAFVSIIPTMKGAESNIKKELSGLGSSVGDSLSKGIEEKTKGVGKNIVNYAISDVNDGRLKNAFSKLGDSIKGSAIGTKIADSISGSQTISKINEGGKKIGNALSASVGKVSNIGSRIADSVANNSTMQKISAGGKKIGATLSNAMSNISGFGSKIASSIGNSSVLSRIGSVGQSIGSGLVTAAGTAFKAGAATIFASLAGAAAGAVATAKSAFDSFADFEQLQGGVEKIFNEADTSQIMQDAQDAYKRLNMSANQYLASINQTGASFAQTMGDQKGYEVARQGMLAISDYASGTGRNLEELNEKFAMITRATSSYQSIADQFSGILPATSKDFLAQAQAAGFLSDAYTELTEVPVAEYQQAIAAMLEKGVADMGLSENTMNEATNTISGSINTLKAAWSNWLTALADPDADMGAMTERLVEAFGIAVTQAVPRIGQIFASIFDAVPKAIADFKSRLPELMSEIFANLDEMSAGTPFEGMGDRIKGIIEQIAPTVEGLQNTFGNLFDTLMGMVEQFMPTLLNIGDFLTTLWTGTISPVLEAASEILGEIWEIIGPFVSYVLEEISARLPIIGELIGSVVGSALEVIKGIIPVIETIWQFVEPILHFAVELIMSIVDVVLQVIGVVAKIGEAFADAFTFVMGAVDGFLQGLLQPFKDAFNAIADFWNSTVGQLKWTVPDWVPGLGGQEIGAPTLPKLADGGIVTRATEVIAGEGADDEAILPLNERGARFAKAVFGDGGNMSPAEMAAAAKAGVEAGMAGFGLYVNGSKLANATASDYDKTNGWNYTYARRGLAHA